MLMSMVALCITGAAPAQPGIILDTDFRSDVDDAGSLALLNALADQDECALLGVIASQTGPHAVAAINAVNTWYGRPGTPIGLSPIDDQRFDDHYAPRLGDPEQFPSSQRNATAPESTRLYRSLLREASGGSVRIAVIGGMTCLRLLMDSEADHEGDGSINRTGRELIEAKVEALYLMAGNFANPEHAEHNVMLDLEAAQKIVAEWPTPIYFSGFEIGRAVQTGGAMTEPERNPVAMAYKLFPAGGRGTIASSASYDQTLVYLAVRGVMLGDEALWRLSEPGCVSFPGGKTQYEPCPDGRHRYLIEHAPVSQVEAAIEALMTQPPQRPR